MTDGKTILVLGATGGVGGEVARAFHNRGWTVIGLARDTAAARADNPKIDWRPGDAMDAETVRRAAAGCDVIFHGLNPPRYRNWKAWALPMLDNTIAAAESAGATILFPGTLYNFAPEDAAVMTETTPQRARTRKGRIRIEMERRLANARAQAVIVRAGDFYGPRAGKSSWIANAMIRPGQPVRTITDPSTPGVGHAFAYLPDLAATFALLAARRAELGKFETFHFHGHWVDDGRAFAEAIRNAAQAPKARISPLPWGAIMALAPFVRLFREMAEVRYLWRVDGRLDNAKLVRFLGAEPHTRMDEALRATLAGLNCLPESAGDNMALPFPPPLSGACGPRPAVPLEPPAFGLDRRRRRAQSLRPQEPPTRM